MFGRRLLPGWVAAFAALALYTATLAPTVTSEDSGELIAAAARLGVPHPPGFPLWVLLTALISAPFSPAWGANFASAIYAAGTVGLLAGITSFLTSKLPPKTPLGIDAFFYPWVAPVAAVSAGLLLAASQTFWSQAIIAEVYSLNTLLLLGTWALLLRWETHRRPATLFWAAGVYGLSLANHHPLTLLTAPAIAGYLFWVDRSVFRPNSLVRLFLALLPGVSLYLYLPWAAQRGPPINWGDPAHWDTFWAHVSRSSYRSLELGEAVTWADKWAFLKNLGNLISQQWGWWPLYLSLAAAGLFYLPRPQKLLLGGIALLNTLGLILILRFRFEPEHIMRVNEYYLPAYAVLAVALGLALARLLSRYPRLIPLTPILWLVPLWHNYPANQLRHDWLAYDFNHQALMALEPNAIFYPSGDYSSFPTLYLKAVEGLRPDVLLADYTGHPAPEAIHLAREQNSNLDSGDPAAIQAALLQTGRPLYLAAKSDLKVSGVRTQPWGLVYRVLRPDQTAGPGPKVTPLDPQRRPAVLAALERSILSDHALMSGEALLVSKDSAGAHANFLEAERWSEDSKEGLNNLGSTLAEGNFKWDAERLYRKAAALSPHYLTPRRNLALLLDGQGRFPEATLAFEALVAAAPDDQGAHQRWQELRRTQANPDILARVAEFEAATQDQPRSAPLWNNLGSAYAEQRDAQKAIAAYQRALTLDPNYTLARKNLNRVFQDLVGDIFWAEKILITANKP